MKQSKLFSKTRKNISVDEISKNAQLLIRAGYIHKEMAGVYAYLPLGLRVIEKIKSIVNEEMNAIGGQEIIMTVLQKKELWERTDRWSDEKVDIWFKSKLKNKNEVGLGWSHEEPITNMMIDHITSFRDLPVMVYQFQTKLRNELRAKSGIMRGREFLMKDLYSYSLDEASHKKIYDLVAKAYMKVFKRTGIGKDTFVTFAPGGLFTKEFSHEFQTITENGEDSIYIDRKKNIAINTDIDDKKVFEKLGVKKENLEKISTSEVGNIFSFGTKKAEELGLFYKNNKGESKLVWIGSYGIGITRLMGVIAEKMSDEKGLIWPKEVAPFSVHLIAVEKTAKVRRIANKIYQDLEKQGIEVLYDDRETKSAGEKFAEADLIGIPYRVVVSEKTLKTNSVEIKERNKKLAKIIKISKLVNAVK